MAGTADLSTPNTGAGPAQPSGSVPQGPSQQMFGAPPSGPAQPQQQLSHEHAMALLDHLHGMEKKFRALMDDPGTGKKSIRPKMHEMLSDMMGQRLMTLPQAMEVLNSFPTDPFQQRNWLGKKMKETVRAEQMLLQEQIAQRQQSGADFSAQLQSPSAKPSRDGHLIDAMTILHGRKR